MQYLPKKRLKKNVNIFRQRFSHAPAKPASRASLEFMKKIALLTLIFVLGNLAISAQDRKFQWEDEICVFEGTYDSRLYTKRQLEGAYRLWFSLDFDMEIYKARITYVNDIEKLPTVSEIDEEYKRKSADLRGLAVVNLAFWKNLKAKKLKTLEQEYEFARAAVQAFQKPSALREVKFAAVCAEKFVPPLLAGDDGLLMFWREREEHRFKNSTNAETERRNFENLITSADNVKYAQVDIISYAWWNCANALIDRDESDTVASQNFWKLFKHVARGGCDYA
jgi:hypothetical protein